MKLTWHNADLKLNAWRTISNRHKPLQLPISNRRLPSSSFARYFFSCSNSSTKSPFTRINFCHHKNNDSSNNQQLSRPSSLIKTSLWMASGVLYCPNLSLVSGYRRCVGGVELSSAFVDSWQDWRRFGRLTINCGGRSLMKRRMRRRGALVIVSEVAGQYEDSFEDVKSQIMNYFTYKAVRTVMNQLYEMNPTQYRWLYDFVVNNKPGDGKRFLRILGKERRELAERVMVTRLHLYAKWVKKCDHAEIYKEISDQNLELMRERLMETVIWPSDDTNTEKVG